MLERRYHLQHLTDDHAEELRRLMVAELHWAVEHGKLYYSQYFTEAGRKEYPLLLQKALLNGNPDSLEESLNHSGCLHPSSPKNAAQTFAWDEFNKYYMRALCLLAQNLAGYALVVARGRHSENPKRESSRLMGHSKDPATFLATLRNIPKVNPFGANSGLTLELHKIADERLP
jgi:hypothetical protein